MTVPNLPAAIVSMPCSHCPEDTVVFLLHLHDDRPVERLCGTHWADRVAVEQEHRT